MAGGGSGPQQANWEVHCPIPWTFRDSVTSRHSARAPAVEGDGAEFPAPLGLQSDNGVAGTDVDQKRMTSPEMCCHEIPGAPALSTST